MTHNLKKQLENPDVLVTGCLGCLKKGSCELVFVLDRKKIFMTPFEIIQNLSIS